MATRDDLLSASTKANSVIDEFDLKRRVREGGYTRIDPAFVASLVDVPVMYRKLDRLLGGFIREPDGSGILVNADRSRGLVHMTCAHELGHFFLGHESTADDKLDHDNNAALVERLADQFAYSLLAPRWLIAATMRARQWTVADLSDPFIVYQLSLRLGASYTAMVWSLQRTSVIQTALAEQLQAVAPKTLKQMGLGGRSLEDPKSDVWALGPADRDCILEPGYGDKFVVQLPNHAGSGHLWSVDELRSDGFELQPFVVDVREQPKAPTRTLEVGGGPKMMNYTLEPPTRYRSRDVDPENLDSLSDRRCAIQLVETTPWDEAARAGDAFAFSTEFEPTNDGFTVSERQRRVSSVRARQ